jgi:hypothetical protein
VLLRLLVGISGGSYVCWNAPLLLDVLPGSWSYVTLEGAHDSGMFGTLDFIIFAHTSFHEHTLRTSELYVGADAVQPNNS